MTDDAAILALAPVIMAIHAVRISGQMGNCVYGGCLKTASDAKATLLIGVFIMPFYVFFGSYLLGTVLGFGLVGYWIGAALDEFTRCFLMRARWKSRKWEKQCFKN
ncbi:MAG: hypothetical protein MJ082_00050 [Clostridia bacterium]|nr:hypothetical protein [Clostridia bacterium]